MAIGYINPQLAAVLAAQKLTPPQANMAPPVDPLAPAPANPQAPPPDQLSFNSVNDGINSVGRPSDLAAMNDDAMSGVDAGLKQSKHDAELNKLMRQGKGQALLALGAALLGSRTFGEGMSKGLAAYVQTLNATRDRYTPKHETIGDGTYDKATDPVDDSVSYTRTPYADEKQKQLNIVTGGKLDVAKIGATAKTDVADINNSGAWDRTTYSTDAKTDTADKNRASQERIAQWGNTAKETVARINGQYRAANKGPNKLQVAAMTAANNAPDSLARYDRIEQMIDSGDSGVGPGLWNKVKRAYVNTTGQSGLGVDVTHMQELDRDLHTIEAQAGALMLGGQGQVSDGERKMVHDAMPNMDTDPTAIKAILQVLRAKAKRDALGLSISASGDTYPRDSEGTDAPSAPAATSSGVKWRIVH